MFPNNEIFYFFLRIPPSSLSYLRISNDTKMQHSLLFPRYREIERSRDVSPLSVRNEGFRFFGKGRGPEVGRQKGGKRDPRWKTKRRVLKACRLMVVDVSTRLLIRRPYTLAELFGSVWMGSHPGMRRRVYATDLD